MMGDWAGSLPAGGQWGQYAYICPANGVFVTLAGSSSWAAGLTIHSCECDTVLQAAMLLSADWLQSRTLRAGAGDRAQPPGCHDCLLLNTRCVSTSINIPSNTIELRPCWGGGRGGREGHAAAVAAALHWGDDSNC